MTDEDRITELRNQIQELDKQSEELRKELIKLVDLKVVIIQVKFMRTTGDFITEHTIHYKQTLMQYYFEPYPIVTPDCFIDGFELKLKTRPLPTVSKDEKVN